ncbi:nitrosoguanidine resistance protein Sng1p [Diutina catenulata]
MSSNHAAGSSAETACDSRFKGGNPTSASASSTPSNMEDEEVRSYLGVERPLSPEDTDFVPNDLERQANRAVDQNCVSFFNANLHSVRRRIATKFLFLYLVMAVGVLCLFPLYWGSMMHRTAYQKNFEMLVVVEDTDMVNNVPPVIGETLRRIVETPEALAHGHWQVYSTSEFAKLHDEPNTEQGIMKLVHEQKYWSALWVKSNASHNFYEAIVQNDVHYDVSNSSVAAIYETGRDFQTIPGSVLPGINFISNLLTAHQPNITKTIRDALSGNGADADTIVGKAYAVISQPMSISMHDMIPMISPVILAPGQVGLIYMVILTFFQFNFFAELHKEVAQTKMKKPHYLAYRILSSFLSYFILSLVYSLVSLAFQMDFTRAFGRAGFVVYWMTNFLTMCAVGTTTEVAAHLLIIAFPPLLGFWLMFWILSNVAPTFTPMALTAKFYRYGYAMPIHNAYEITKIIFFNTYRGAMGRAYGIIVAWVVISNVLLCFVIPLFGKVMGRRAMLANQEVIRKYEERKQE